MRQFPLLLKCLALCFLPALGAFFSQPDEWYQALQKPPGNPPPAVFGPVWTTLYFMMGLALFDYSRRESATDKTPGQVAFGLQLALNAAWSPVFFMARSPRWSLLTIVLMLVAIGVTIYQFRKVSGVAAALLVPYLCWVSYATYLNAGIAVLNPPE